MANPRRKPLPDRALLDQLISYDLDTGLAVWKTRPILSKYDKMLNSKYAGKPAGSLDPSGYMAISINNTKFRLHRILFKLATGDEPEFVDHVNRDKTLNILSNLRPATASENQCNGRPESRSRSGYKGVELTPNGKYRGRVKLNGVNYSCGTFAKLEDAVMAAANARRNLHGAFARD